jgi:phosphotriesterase-related protein
MTCRREFLKGIAAAGVVSAAGCVNSKADQASTQISKIHSAGKVQTVLGPLDPSELGFTLTHEHIADGPVFLKHWPASSGGRTEFVSAFVDKLKAVRAGGVSTIVDLTTYDVGRDIRFLEEVSRRSGMNVVAATGQRLLPPQIEEEKLVARTADEFAAFFISEIELGIDRTGIKAGAIKVAAQSRNLTPLEENALRGAARACRATGIPIATHTHARQRGGETQIEIFEAEDVSPSRVSLGHSDDSGELDYLLNLVARGYTLGLDHVNRGVSADFKPPLETRATFIKELVAAGFADRLFLSHDSEFGSSLLPEDKKEFREKLNPDGMLFNTRKLIPYLKQIGVSDVAIKTITIDNPARFFARA